MSDRHGSPVPLITFWPAERGPESRRRPHAGRVRAAGGDGVADDLVGSGAHRSPSASPSLSAAAQRPEAATSVTGVLLVGGAKRRFGRVAGETLAARAWRVLGDVCDERITVGTIGEGPLAAIVAGLQVARTDVCLVVPVDCPSLGAATLEELVAACGDVALLGTGSLAGAYRKSALPALERSLAAGRQLADALAGLDVATVQFDDEAAAMTSAPRERIAIVA